MDREVAERVERALRERSRQSAASESPKRRKLVQRGHVEQVSEEEDVEEDLASGANNRLEMSALTRLGDPNCSILQDSAAIAVVRATPAAESSPSASRPTRQLFRCVFEGCTVARNSREALRLHIENNHE